MAKPALDRVRKKELRAEFEKEVMAAFANFGPDFDKSGLMRKYTAAGLNTSSLYRWFDAIKTSGAPGRAFAEKVRDNVRERSQASQEPAVAIGADIVAELPVVPDPDEIVGLGVGKIVDQMQMCMNVARRILKYSFRDDGKPRNAKLALSASEHLRRSVDTMARLYEMMIAYQQVEAFHKTIFEVIRDVDPIVAETILGRLRQLNATQRGGAG
ncbi:hypothetical protein LDL36_20325 [Komagataeibacter sp. FNDCR1]|nr:hypothetical protein [Komagataeibacter sp. FNDCR1]